MRKKNYIGDKFIVEKDETAAQENQEDQQNNIEEQKAGEYAQRMNKIKKIYEESTQEHNKFLKEIDIHKTEEKILAQAKRNQ